MDSGFRRNDGAESDADQAILSWQRLRSLSGGASRTRACRRHRTLGTAGSGPRLSRRRLRDRRPSLRQRRASRCSRRGASTPMRRPASMTVRWFRRTGISRFMPGCAKCSARMPSCISASTAISNGCPGKALALSAECWPELCLGPTPLIYPFIVNDPGEGAQAKRRTSAVIVDHLMPAMTRAETARTARGARDAGRRICARRRRRPAAARASRARDRGHGERPRPRPRSRTRAGGDGRDASGASTRISAN